MQFNSKSCDASASIHAMRLGIALQAIKRKATNPAVYKIHSKVEILLDFPKETQI